MVTLSQKPIYWHRELPPLDAEPIGDYSVEVTSAHVPGTISHRDELWDRCYEDLMANAAKRLEQEIRRLGGDYAHVFAESVDSRRNDALNEAWLHGTTGFVVYRAAKKSR
jgi:hypothetical protein